MQHCAQKRLLRQSGEWFVMLMVCDANGVLTNELRLEDKSAKGKSGGVVYLSSRLQDALAEPKEVSPATRTIIKTCAGKSLMMRTLQTKRPHLSLGGVFFCVSKKGF
jgi:hypothetical protein